MRYGINKEKGREMRGFFFFYKNNYGHTEFTKQLFMNNVFLYEVLYSCNFIFYTMISGNVRYLCSIVRHIISARAFSFVSVD